MSFLFGGSIPDCLLGWQRFGDLVIARDHFFLMSAIQLMPAG
jgi:hypothetical protein